MQTNRTNRMKPVIGSKRNGQTHKSWLGCFTVVTCTAIVQAIINTMGHFGCMACGKPFDVIAGPRDAGFETDHFVPVQHFDSNGLLRDHSIDNVCILCYKCHAPKKTRMPETVFTSEQIAFVKSIQAEAKKLKAENSRVPVGKRTWQNTAQQLAMRSRKFARLYDASYLRIYWPE